MLETEPDQDAVWSRFCSVYLPALVDRFLDPYTPMDDMGDSSALKQDYKLNNPWFSTLVAIQHSPYFGKYLRSQKPIAVNNLRLTQIIAERLIVLAPRWDNEIRRPRSEKQRHYVNCISNAVQVLSSLCASYTSKAPVSESILSVDTKAKLLPFVQEWRDDIQFKSTFLHDVSSRLCLQLSATKNSNPEFYRMILKFKKRLKGWDRCGYPFCSANQEKSSNLKACGRCQTVRYVSSFVYRAVKKLQVCDTVLYRASASRLEMGA